MCGKCPTCKAIGAFCRPGDTVQQAVPQSDRFETRITELAEIAVEEGIVVDPGSERDLRSFVDEVGEPDALFLLEGGHYRGRWLDGSGGTSVMFAGDGRMEAVHIPPSKAVQGAGTSHSS